jgi:drug/metabolite transporter (DMT)-like permease
VSRKALLLFAATSVIWGSSFLFIRVAVEHLPPSAVVFGRTVLGAAFLVPLAIRARAFRGLRQVIVPIAVVTVLDMAAPTFLTAWGEQHISSSVAGILTATDPLFTAVLALWLIRSEVPGRKRLAGLVIGFAGVIALLGIDFRGSAVELLAAEAVLLGALGYAGAALVYRRWLPDVPAIGVTALMTTLSSLAFLAPAVVSLPPRGAPRQQPPRSRHARDRQHRRRLLAVLPADRPSGRGHRLGDHLRDAGRRPLPRRRAARGTAHHRRHRRADPDRPRRLAGDQPPATKHQRPPGTAHSARPQPRQPTLGSAG